MNTILFDKNTQKKVVLVGYLSTLPEGQYTIHKLSAALNFSYDATLLLVNGVHRDFKELGYGAFLSPQNKILWEPKNYNPNNYLQLLVHHSMPYQFLLSTLIEPKLTTDQFCKKHQISRATLARRLTKFGSYVRKFGVRMNLSKMTLIGSEVRIRMLYFCFLWTGKFGLDLITTYENPENEKLFLEKLNNEWLDHIVFKEKWMVLTISRIRYLQGHLIEDGLLDDLVFPEALWEIQDVAEDYIEDKNTLVREVRFVGYMLLYVPHFVNHPDKRLSVISYYYQKLQFKGDPLATATDYLSKEINNKILRQQLSIEEEQLMRANIFSALLNLSILHGTTPIFHQMSARMDYEHPDYQYIKEIISDILPAIEEKPELKWLVDCHDDFVDDLGEIVYLFLMDEKVTEKLKVALVPSPNFVMVNYLIMFLKHLDFVEIYYHQPNNFIADCYLTTFSDLLEPEEKPYFIVPIEASKEYQSELFDKLWKLYLQKIHYERPADENLIEEIEK